VPATLSNTSGIFEFFSMKGVQIIARRSEPGLLVAIVLLSASTYVTRLGFYSDDWAYLGTLNSSDDKSLFGLLASQWNVHAELRMRPSQILYQGTLFSLFGLHPLGYHIANLLVFTFAIVLLFATLTEMGVARLHAVSVALVFALLPNYSTDRFWLAAFGYFLMLALFLLSFYADLRGVRSGGSGRLLAWKMASLAALLLAGLGYEVILPFALLSPLVVWIRASRAMPGRVKGRLTTLAAAAYIASHYLVLVGVVIFKAATATGASPDPNYLFHVARLGFGAVATNFGTYLVAFPHTTWWSLGNATPSMLLVSALIGVVVFGYFAMPSRGSVTRERIVWIRIAGLGMIAFALGYGLAFLTGRIGFSSTGILNRAAIGAAIGLAALIVGLIGTVSSWESKASTRQRLYAGGIALYCSASTLVVSVLGMYWVAAWPIQERVLEEIQAGMPELPSGSTVLLHGICPYVGPAIVFESSWDLAGALQVRYQDPTLEADVTGRMTVVSEGVATHLYGPLTSAFHRFGPRLILFDARTGSVIRLTNASILSAYLAKHPTPDCGGIPGQGSLMLPMDRLYLRSLDRLYLRWFS
jgi:hypothetical protein